VKLDESAMAWSVPAGERAGRPFLLALHGHNGDEYQLAPASAELPRDLVIVTPRAPYLEPGGWSWFELNEAGGPDAAASVTAQLLSWLDRQTGYTSYGVLGLSQGAAMAMSLMRADPHRFDYGLQLSGFAIDTTPDAALAAVRPPMFSAHGDLDDVIPAAMVADTSRFLREHTRLTEKRYPNLGHAIDPVEIADAAAFVRAQLVG
jgi:phospholipase/carboxylesterase